LLSKNQHGPRQKWARKDGKRNALQLGAKQERPETTFAVPWPRVLFPVFSLLRHQLFAGRRPKETGEGKERGERRLPRLFKSQKPNSLEREKPTRVTAPSLPTRTKGSVLLSQKGVQGGVSYTPPPVPTSSFPNGFPRQRAGSWRMPPHQQRPQRFSDASFWPIPKSTVSRTKRLWPPCIPDLSTSEVQKRTRKSRRARVSLLGTAG
jgi:hypothetical protein